MNLYFGIFISFASLNLCFAKDAVVQPQLQELRMGFRNFDVNRASVSNIHRQLRIIPDGFVILEDYSLNFKKNSSGTNQKGPATQTTVNIKYAFETLLTPKFEWKSTRLIETSTGKKTSSFVVAGKEIIVSTQVDASPAKTKKVPHKNKTLPLSAVPYFLFNQGRKQIGIPNDLDIFFETEQSLNKISWVYLGTSIENKKKIHRFEIKGGLSQIIQMDTEGHILKIKDLKNDYELTDIR